MEQELSKDQARYEELVEKLKVLEKCINDLIPRLHTLSTQLKENENVKAELDILEEDGEVYKLIGPALVKQDPDEAKQNVDKRIEFITRDYKSVEDKIKDMTTESDKIKGELMTIQAKVQRMVASAQQ